nr:hypothetical protein [Tanacetum cinerariifolium]
MADHSQKWHNGSTSGKVSNDSSNEIAAITNKLNSLGRDIKKLKDNLHAIRVGCKNYGEARLNKECPLHEESPKEIEYFSANSSSSDKEVQEEAEVIEEIEKVVAHHEHAHQKVTPSNMPIVSYYVAPYKPSIPFPRHLEQHAKEALVHKAMESLKRMKEINFIRSMYQKVVFRTKNNPDKTLIELVCEIRNEKSVTNNDLMNIDHDLCTGAYEEIGYRCSMNELRRLGKSEPWKSMQNDRKRILKDYWRQELDENQKDMIDISPNIDLTQETNTNTQEDYKDLENFREEKLELILDIVLDKLDDGWFSGTTNDEDDLDGITDYLE